MAAKGVTVRDVDHGFAALLARAAGLEEPPSIAVGVLARDAATTEPGGEVTVLDVATWNEFGTETIPARSFIRAWVDEHQAEARKLLGELLKKVIAGKLTEERALEQFGAWAKGSIQQRMARGVPPPNAASTVARKGSSTPLIDTGILRSSIDYEIRRE